MDAEKVNEQFTEAERADIETMSKADRLYQLMTDSVAPHVFGTCLCCCCVCVCVRECAL